MSDKSLPSTDRRGWLVGAIRYTTLGGLLLGSGLLASRRAGRACPDLTIACDNCQLWSGCALPRAHAARNADQGKGRA